MKKLLLFSFILLTSLACEDECENTTEDCTEVPPIGELSHDYFMRLFYNSTSNAC